MRVRKENPAAGKPIDVRRQRLRMAAQAADPVVEIVEGDEEDVWTRARVRRLVLRTEYRRQHQPEDPEATLHGTRPTSRTPAPTRRVRASPRSSRASSANSSIRLKTSGSDPETSVVSPGSRRRL